MKLHLWATIFWSFLAIPTVVWWRESIAWVSFMSIYAIIVGHWGSYQAARAEQAVKQNHNLTESGPTKEE